jgi:hypothetical protein
VLQHWRWLEYERDNLSWHIDDSANWNGGAYTLESLVSFVDAEDQNGEHVVVNNVSGVRSGDKIRESQTEIAVLQSSANLSFTIGEDPSMGNATSRRA